MVEEVQGKPYNGGELTIIGTGKKRRGPLSVGGGWDSNDNCETRGLREKGIREIPSQTNKRIIRNRSHS